MPAVAIATTAASWLADEDPRELEMAAVFVFNAFLAVLIFGAICGWVKWQTKQSKPPKRRR